MEDTWMNACMKQSKRERNKEREKESGFAMQRRLWCDQVNEVQPGQVVVTDAPTNTKKHVEFGTCIWTTGIKMHPLVGKLAKTLPQGLLLCCLICLLCMTTLARAAYVCLLTKHRLSCVFLLVAVAWHCG